ncbi:DNA polymerase subunit gamma-2, mitochondrial [Anticarsia gemmatalis]|uniref:DNA polymerase subunit gamma-2, mitochondrial n=1 Tax=Anticarsia gemmatalis TaxID=129554 RepID=UPI003F76903D
MKTEIQKLFNLKHYFRIVQSNKNNVTYSLKEPSQMLIKNIHVNWLQYIYSKTYKEMPVYVNGARNKLESTSLLYGSIEQNIPEYSEDTIIDHNLCDSNLKNSSQLQFDLIFPQQDAMQYFIKWQRYRKYWWSSISTTPSLFAVNDIKYEDKLANVDIIAQMESGEQPVENISINFGDNDKLSCLRCSMSLENALFILLLDGFNNNTKEGYLRLHRKIAPYKISFALNLDNENPSENKTSLKQLATLLYHKLESHKISTWFPDFTLPYESQIKQNLHLGVPYTAILNTETLKNGIFRLMNSSTMLGEQVHVADFHKYAAVIFEK